MPANWKMFKIIERKYWEKQNPEYIYFNLNIWFWFANDKSNMICCVYQEPFKDWKVGDIIKIDLNWTIQKNTARDDCTIRSVEVAQLVDEVEFYRMPAENLFASSFFYQPQPQIYNSFNLPPVSAVENGNYQWGSENTNLVYANEEFQAAIQQQNFPPKKK